MFVKVGRIYQFGMVREPFWVVGMLGGHRAGVARAMLMAVMLLRCTWLSVCLRESCVAQVRF